MFDEDMILNENIPVSDWPIVHCLICFKSNHFPYQRAVEYVALRKPFCINDVPSQSLLFDRKTTYDLLTSNGILTPRRICVDRNDPNHDESKIIDTPEYVEIYGERIYKPVVEKPFDSDNHNIWIHYGRGNGVKHPPQPLISFLMLSFTGSNNCSFI